MRHPPSGAQTFGFIQRTTVPQSVADSAFVALTFDDVTDRAEFSNVSPSGPAGARTGFIVPRDGLYRVSLAAFVDGSVDTMAEVILTRNGGGASLGMTTPAAGFVTGGVVIADVVQLSRGDVIATLGRFVDTGGGPHDVLGNISLELITT